MKKTLIFISLLFFISYWCLSDIENYPSDNCRIFNFENNCKDQLGIDDWDTKRDIAYNSTYKKFGSYSLFTSLSASFLYSPTAWGTVGESVSFGVWIRPENVNGTDVGYNDLSVGDGTTGNDYIILRIYKSPGNWNLIAYVVKDNEPQEFLSATDYLTNGDWNYAAISYDSENNTLYLVSNSNIYSMIPGGTWGSRRDMDLRVHTRNNTWLKTYLDELLVAPDQFIDPQIFVDHYNNDVPWGGEYIP